MLPLSVQEQDYEKSNLGWLESSARVVYVELKGMEDAYGVINDESEFEIV